MSRENRVIGKDLKYWPLMVSLVSTKSDSFKEWLSTVDLQLLKRYVHVFFATDLRIVNIDTVDLFEVSKLVKAKSFFVEDSLSTKEDRILQEDKDVELMGALIALEYFNRKKPKDPNVMELCRYDVKDWRVFHNKKATGSVLNVMLEAKNNPIFALYALINYESCLI